MIRRLDPRLNRQNIKLYMSLIHTAFKVRFASEWRGLEILLVTLCRKYMEILDMSHKISRIHGIPPSGYIWLLS